MLSIVVSRPLFIRYAGEMEGLLMQHLSSVSPVRPVPAPASPWLECVLLGLGRVESCCRARVWCPPSPVPSYLQLLISDGWSTAAAKLNQGRVSSNVSHPDTSSSRYPSILPSCIKYNFTFIAISCFPTPAIPALHTNSRVSPNCQIIPYKPRP